MAAPPTPASAMDADADADEDDCLSTTQETAVERSVSRRPAEVPGKERTKGRGKAPVLVCCLYIGEDGVTDRNREGKRRRRKAFLGEMEEGRETYM